MEDTDLQRSKPAWDKQILEDLAWLGLTWDGPVLRQSEHLPRYAEAVQRFEAMDLLYPCSCSRADIQAALAAPQEGARPDLYPGTCKHRALATRRPGDALRLHLDRALERLGSTVPCFSETGPAKTGQHEIDPAAALSDIGDVVIQRKGEEIAAYFLASALDDAFQDITVVVRGQDLFDFTPIQVILLQLLGLPVPTYHHHRLIRDETGKRLAKRDDARAIATYRAAGATPDQIREMVAL